VEDLSVEELETPCGYKTKDNTPSWAWTCSVGESYWKEEMGLSKTTPRDFADIVWCA